jgi:hypothetical protein
MALPYYLDSYPLIVERSWHKLAAVGVFSADTATSWRYGTGEAMTR